MGHKHFSVPYATIRVSRFSSAVCGAVIYVFIVLVAQLFQALQCLADALLDLHTAETERVALRLPLRRASLRSDSVVGGPCSLQIGFALDN